MKIRQNKIQLFALVFLLLLLGVIFTIQFFLPKKISLKSKAAETATLSLVSNKTTAAAGTDFTITIKVTPASALAIQVYKVYLTFDKSKIKIKDNGISYLVGSESTNLGAHTNSSISSINGTAGTATLNIIGEIQSASGLTLTGERSLAEITFVSKTSAEATIGTTGESKLIKINSDYTLGDVILSNPTFVLNSTGATATPTPTGAPTPTPTGAVSLSLKLKFQGILSKPKDEFNKMKVKVTLKYENDDPIGSVSSDFVAGSDGVWSGTANFNKPDLTRQFKVLIKGPTHIQKRVCDTKPTETAPGSYRCTGGITLTDGVNNLDFSGIYQLVGDLPEQDGVVNSYDTSLVRNNLGKTDAEALRLADVNLDGRVDTQDYSLIISALSVRADEE